MLHVASRKVRLNFKVRGHPAPLEDDRPEGRQSERHLTILRVAMLHAGDAKELCVVRNISAGGLSARVYRLFEVGEAVQVEFRNDERIPGVVKWARQFEIGIAFAEEVSIDAVLTSRWATDDGRRQRLPRIGLECPCQLRVGARFYLATLADISQGGAKVQLRQPLQGDADAILTLPDLGWLEASIHWANESQVGLAFNERLPFEVLVRWIQERRRGNPNFAAE